MQANSPLRDTINLHPPSTPPRRGEKELLAPITDADSPNTRLYKSIANNNPTPEKKFPLYRDDEGDVRVDISPTSKKVANAIYRFKNEKTKEVLIGKTEVPVKNRLSGYVKSFNDKKAPDAHLRLPIAVRKSPEDFTFGILTEVSPERSDVDLGKLEDTYIVHRDAINKGYNVRRGGAGAKKRKELTPKKIKKLHDMAPDLLRQDSPLNFGTFFRKPDGSVGVNIDSTIKKTRGVAYAFTEMKKKKAYKKKASEDTPTEKRRYVGITKQNFGKRFSTHLHYANNPEKPKADAELYKRLRKHPERFKVDIRKKLEDDLDLLEPVEALLIKRYDSFKNGFNRNRGAYKLLEKHDILPKD